MLRTPCGADLAGGFSDEKIFDGPISLETLAFRSIGPPATINRSDDGATLAQDALTRA
jgi:hypothetical protein